MSDIDEKPSIKIGELEGRSIYADSPVISWLDELHKIKGIGKENIKDIARIYHSKEELVQALIEDKVSLRNDVVQILKINLLK